MVMALYSVGATYKVDSEDKLDTSDEMFLIIKRFVTNYDNLLRASECQKMQSLIDIKRILRDLYSRLYDTNDDLFWCEQCNHMYDSLREARDYHEDNIRYSLYEVKSTAWSRQKHYVQIELNRTYYLCLNYVRSCENSYPAKYPRLKSLSIRCLKFLRRLIQADK